MTTQRMGICAALPLVFLSGCFSDGDTSDREEIETVIERNFDAALNGDVKTYCSLMTGRAFATFDGPATQEDCERRGFRDMVVSKEDRADVAGMRVTVKSIDGNRAKATVLMGGRDEDPFPLLLREVDGKWLISDWDPHRYGEKLRKGFEKVDRSLNTARKLDCSAFRFNAKTWRRDRYDYSDPPSRRQKLADALLKCHTLVGLTRDEVVALLGGHDERNRRTLSWVTGYERSFISIDSEVLYVEFDRDWRARSAGLAPYG